MYKNDICRKRKKENLLFTKRPRVTSTRPRLTRVCCVVCVFWLLLWPVRLARGRDCADETDTTGRVKNGNGQTYGYRRVLRIHQREL